MENLYALDIETTGLSRFKDRILGIGVFSPNYQHYFSSVSDFTTWFKSLAVKPSFVMHNGSFDTGFIKHGGIDISDYWSYDTRSIASILSPRPEQLGLEHLAEKLLGQAPYKLDRKRMEDYSADEIRDYCLKDCELTYKLFTHLQSKLNNKAWQFVESWLMPATKFCAVMEYDGVHVDQSGLERYSEETTKRRDEILLQLRDKAALAVSYYHEKQVKEVSKIYKELYEKAKEKAKDKEKCLRRYALLESAAVSRLEPFNWNSSTQLKWLFKEYYGLSIWNDREEKESTNEAQLKLLSEDNEVAKVLLDYRETEKLVSTCIPALLENIQEDGHVHTHYHIGGTRTGRLSSSGPNLQQIPRGPIRSYVRASSQSRVLVTIDYSQIEVRIIAEVAKETELINAFKEGIDPYSVIAKKLLKINAPVKEIRTLFKKERDVSKTAGLSILYGTGAYKLQEVFKKDLGRDLSIQECKKFIEDYRNSLPGVKHFKESLERSLANNKIYYNLLGRPFTIEDNTDLYMKSLNTLVQGSASDLVMFSALKVKKALDALAVPNNCRLLIHDEQVWELPIDEAEVLVKDVIIPAMTTEIERELGLTVPLAVEYTIDRQWSKP